MSRFPVDPVSHLNRASAAAAAAAAGPSLRYFCRAGCSRLSDPERIELPFFQDSFRH